MIEIACSDCGQGHTVRRRTAKYCPPCRLLRDVAYARKKFRRARKCRVCETPYRPIHAQDYDLCGGCVQPTLTNRAILAGRFLPCGLCAETKALLAGTRVCVECLKDPELQAKAVRGLRASQKDRIKENA